MENRKELKQKYKELQEDKAVFMIKNTVTGRIFLCSSLYMRGKMDRHKFQLVMGGHMNTALQEDWKKYGAESFIFEVLEKVKLKDDPAYNYDDDLKLLEMIWVEKYQPFGDNVYNKNEKIRMS
jgi:hypothetical protein